MRAKEFIEESRGLSSGDEGRLGPNVADSLPAAYVMPELQNNDFYLQYRFGVAMAAARGVKAGLVDYSDVSTFG